MTTTLNTSDDVAPLRGEDRENSPPHAKCGHETETEIHRLGMDREEHEKAFADGCEDRVRAEEIIRRFFEHPTARMMARGTLESYRTDFRRFARVIHLNEYTRRQLAGPKGKRLILEYVSNLPRRSIATQLAALSKIWKLALNLPWPVDVELDIGRLPRVRRLEAPRDDVVRAWREALLREPNPYVRALWLVIAQSGQRPNTVVALEWRHVTYDEAGRPCELRVCGADEELKTDAWVAWWLPPNVSAILVELRNWLGTPGDDTPIFPWYSGWGHFAPSENLRKRSPTRDWRRTSEDMITHWWRRLEKKYGLPHLTPRSMRHWVAKQAREHPRMREEARALMQGHQLEIHNMGDVYDHLSVEENLLCQARKFPQGPLGMFDKITAEVVEEIPAEIMSAVVSYHNGSGGLTALIDALDRWRIETKTEAQRGEQQ